MKYWIYGPATDGIDNKIKMAHILLIRLRTSVPPFYYSIFGANSEAKILSILSESYRNSETFNFMDKVFGTEILMHVILR